MSNRLWKALGLGAGVTALVGKATSSDVSYAQSTGYWNQLSSTNKLQFVASKFVSRITNGSIVMWAPAGNANPSWNIGNALNKWTAIGAVGWVYSAISRHYKLRLPMATQAKDVGIPMFFGGFGGGILDDAQPSHVNSIANTPRGLSSSNVNEGWLSAQ